MAPQTDKNPNEIYNYGSEKSTNRAAKDALKFLVARGVIELVEWDYYPNESDPNSQVIRRFYVYAYDADQPPLVLKPREAMAFAKGARLQYQRIKEAEHADV